MSKTGRIFTVATAVVAAMLVVVFGDRYLEIAAGPGELRKLPAGATIGELNCEPGFKVNLNGVPPRPTADFYSQPGRFPAGLADHLHGMVAPNPERYVPAETWVDLMRDPRPD